MIELAPGLRVSASAPSGGVRLATWDIGMAPLIDGAASKPKDAAGSRSFPDRFRMAWARPTRRFRRHDGGPSMLEDPPRVLTPRDGAALIRIDLAADRARVGVVGGKALVARPGVRRVAGLAAGRLVLRVVDGVVAQVVVAEGVALRLLVVRGI